VSVLQDKEHPATVQNLSAGDTKATDTDHILIPYIN